MAYTINLTDGTIFATVADGTINTSSSMILVGKNYAGYGEFLDENFIHLLENGANTTAPGAPLTGQLWWDKSSNTMKVYNGTTFKTISAATASGSTPTSNVTGDLWFDTTNQQLKVYNGSAFILVGPASTSGQGTSGAIVETITDNVAVDHTVVFLYAGGTRVASVSADATFTPQVAIAGFATIGPGVQMSTSSATFLFRGTASNSTQFNGLATTDFLRANTPATTSGTLAVLNDSGLSVGADADARIIITGSDVFLRNQTQDGNLTLQVNDGGVNTTAININGATGVPGVTGLTNLNANGVGNLGSSSGYFNTVFATATTALYADVAERFAADRVYEPGTVVELGGSAEITKSINELSDNVFGVISTRAAFTMNHGAGSDDTHPPVAMTGRVPVRVTGSVRKGDRLVAAGDGLARAALPGEATAFNVIGRALEDRLTTDQGMVEAIVTIK
jgi:hypothetical protein